ncbi:MAG: hypothetical protein WBB28_17990 [Crinalium sp.]
MIKILDNLWKQMGEEKFIEELAEWLATKQENRPIVWAVLRLPLKVVKYPDALIRQAFSKKKKKGNYKRRHENRVKKRQHLSKIIRTRNN